MTQVQDGGKAFPDSTGSLTEPDLSMSKRELVAALILGASLVRGVEAEGAIEQADRYAAAFVAFYDKLYDRKIKDERKTV